MVLSCNFVRKHPLGCDHIEVRYGGIRYTLYDLLSATDDIQVMYM